MLMSGEYEILSWNICSVFLDQIFYQQIYFFVKQLNVRKNFFTWVKYILAYFPNAYIRLMIG